MHSLLLYILTGKEEPNKTKKGKQQKNDVTKNDDGDDVTSDSSDDDDDVDSEVDDRSIVQGKPTQQELIHKENKKATKKNGFEIAPANHGMCDTCYSFV